MPGAGNKMEKAVSRSVKGMMIKLAGATVALAAVTLSAAGGAAQPGSASPTPAPAAAPAGDAVAHGRQLFADNSCGSCHTLADANASGAVGPSLDYDSGLSRSLVVDRVTNGQGPMPAFGGQLSEKDIGDIAAYVTAVAKKPS